MNIKATEDVTSKSTGLADNCDVIVQLDVVQMKNWEAIKDMNAAEGDDSGTKRFARFIYQLIHAQHSSVADQSNQTAEDIATDPRQDSMAASRTQIEQSENESAAQGKVVGCELSEHERWKIDQTLSTLKDMFLSDDSNIDALKKLLESLMFLNMVDTGGQMAFVEMLPALIVGPALYFIFFRLDRELAISYGDKYEDSETTELATTYCMKEFIFQALSTIACFSKPSEASSECGGALIFGTYADTCKNSPERIQHFESELEENFQLFYKNRILYRTGEGRYFFCINNYDGNDIKSVQTQIEEIITNCFDRISMPASWLVFRIVLHLLHEPVISRAQCEEIAEKLSISSDSLEGALKFYHYYVGSLMYYPDIDSMKNTVICDPQVIFDSVSELIIDTFKPGNLDAADLTMYVEKGQFTLSYITTKYNKRRRQLEDKKPNKKLLSPKQLIDVLEHHHIIAAVTSGDTSDSSSSDHDAEERYIMPAALKPAKDDELELDPPSQNRSCPLGVYFKFGFVPFGVFSALNACLIASNTSPKWVLPENTVVMKNKITYIVDRAFSVTLVSKPSCIMIQVYKDPKTVAQTRNELPAILPVVRQTLESTLNKVVDKMKYKPMLNSNTKSPSDNPFDFAFTCCKEGHSDHLMKVVETDKTCIAECTKDKISQTSLEPKHLLWYEQPRTKPKPCCSFKLLAATFISFMLVVIFIVYLLNTRPLTTAPVTTDAKNPCPLLVPFDSETPIPNENFKELYHAVKVVGDWRGLCVNLKVSKTTMSRLEHSNVLDEDKKRDCLQAFFDSGEATWEKVACSVAEYPIDDMGTAKWIIANYISNATHASTGKNEL